MRLRIAGTAGISPFVIQLANGNLVSFAHLSLWSRTREMQVFLGI